MAEVPRRTVSTASAGAAVATFSAVAAAGSMGAPRLFAVTGAPAMRHSTGFRVAGSHGQAAASLQAQAGRSGGAASSFFAPASIAALGLALVHRPRGRRTSNSRQQRISLRAYANAPQTYEGAPIGPPPDLPSLLLKNRIVYLGAPITNEVTELILAQLLYLNYESADKPLTMYINSTGSTMKNSTRYIGEQKVGLETDAFAIADCMQYIKPQVMTIGIGQAYGTAAMLLGLGTRGKRFALPNATIMLSEPREPPARGPRQAADIQILAREVLQNRSTMSEMMALATGKSREQIVKDTQRCKYLSPDEAVEYGLLDKVLTQDKVKEIGQELPSFVSAL